MNKNELIFLIIVIIAYIICIFAFNVDYAFQITFGGILLIILIISPLEKFKNKFRNKTLSKLAKIIAITSFIIGISISIYEVEFEKSLLIEPIIFIIFFIALICMRLFEKNDES